MRTRYHRGRTLFSQGPIAVRHFPEHVAAEIDLPEGEAASEENCYLVLIGYLSGCNASHRPVHLRAPVEQAAEDEWALAQRVEPDTARVASTVRFDLPAGSSVAQLPEPTDPRLHLRTVAATRAATIWFFGEPSPGRIARHAVQLQDFIALRSLTPVSTADRPAVRAARRGLFDVLTELSIPVAPWPCSHQFRFHRPLRSSLARAEVQAIRMR
jgi:hypothetical protein